MEVLVQPDVPPFLAQHQRPLAVSGVVLSLVGLLLGIGGPAIIEARQTPSNDLPHVLAESAQKIKDRLAHQELEVEAQRRVSLKTVLTISGVIVGFFGAALGTASWARRENSRLSGIAIAVGLTAIAWNYFVVAAIAAVSLFLMAWVISHFHR